MKTQKEKMIRMSKILGAIFKILAIVIIVSLVVIFLFAVLAPSLNVELNSDQISFLSTNMSFNDLDGLRLWMYDTVLAGAVLVAILFVAAGIFTGINREGTPFTKRNSDKIRYVALLLIVYELLVPAIHFLVAVIFFPNTNAAVSIALGNLIVPAVFFCLALIFDYGRQLQQESDETL